MSDRAASPGWRRLVLSTQVVVRWRARSVRRLLLGHPLVRRDDAAERKRRWLGFLGDAMALAGLAFLIATVGQLVDAWGALPKGDDAFLHLGYVRFFSENWPHVWWFPNSHMGEPTLSTYPVALYALLAVVMELGVPLERTLQLTLFVSLVASAWIIYAFGRSLGLARLLAFTGASILLAAPSVWNVSLVGGAYIRVAGLPFFFASLAACYWYVDAARRDGAVRRKYVLLVASLVGAALMHPFIFQFTLPMTLGILLLGMRGALVTRLRSIAAVILPVVALAAWQYVPLLSSFFGSDQTVAGAARHDTSLMRPEWLRILPREGEWSISLGPILFWVGVVSSVYALRLALRYLRGTEAPATSFVAIACITGATIYFSFLAWLPMPDSLYLVAAYDYVLWASLSLVVLATLCLAEVLRAHPGLRIWLSGSLPVGVLTVVVAMTPWLTSISTTSNASDGGATGIVVRAALEDSSDAFRLGVVYRTATRWLPYERPAQQFLGGRSSVSPHRYFYEWMSFEALYRYEDLDQVYFEDRPKVQRIALDDDTNMYPALFWLDWFGARVALPHLPLSPGDATAQAYRARPHLVTHHEVQTVLGSAAVIELPTSGPMTSVSHTAPVAVPFLRSAVAPFYTDLLELASSLNLGPSFLVPVLVQDGEDLANFETALVPRYVYETHEAELDAFARSGGRVVVLGSLAKEGTRSVSYAAGSIRAVASLLPSHEVSKVFARARRGPVGACAPLGRGTLCTLGIAMGDLRNSRDVAAATLLLRAVRAAVRVDVTSAVAANESGDDSSFALEHPVRADSSGYITLDRDLYALARAPLVVRLLNDRGERLKRVVDPGEWPGPADLHLPLASFTGTSWTARRFDAVSVAARPTTGDRSARVDTLRLQKSPPRRRVQESSDASVAVTTIEPVHEQIAMPGRWLRPTTYEVDLTSRSSEAPGLLWKENYVGDWDVSTSDAVLSHHFAGPGLVWVPIGDAAVVRFDMPPPRALVAGLALSGLLAMWCAALALRRWSSSRAPSARAAGASSDEARRISGALGR
jgi:hypothetical protein